MSNNILQNAVPTGVAQNVNVVPKSDIAAQAAAVASELSSCRAMLLSRVSKLEAAVGQVEYSSKVMVSVSLLGQVERGMIADSDDAKMLRQMIERLSKAARILGEESMEWGPGMMDDSQ